MHGTKKFRAALSLCICAVGVRGGRSTGIVLRDGSKRFGLATVNRTRAGKKHPADTRLAGKLKHTTRARNIGVESAAWRICSGLGRGLSGRMNYKSKLPLRERKGLCVSPQQFDCPAFGDKRRFLAKPVGVASKQENFHSEIELFVGPQQALGQPG